MDDGWARLLAIVKETSFRSDAQPVFRLASGRDSRYYVDCKQALSYPEARALIGELICERVADGTFDAVGGMEIGAYPIATSVSDAAFRAAGITLRAFVVRKEAKGHGVGNLLAGDARKGDRALIVEDVITSGKSTIDAINRARAAGLQVSRVVALVDREEDNGRANIEALGVRCESLFTLSDLIRDKAQPTSPVDPRSDGGESA
jgi:orotate phosphoribosyltransferase